jgi:hypothetical protein
MGVEWVSWGPCITAECKICSTVQDGTLHFPACSANWLLQLQVPGSLRCAVQYVTLRYSAVQYSAGRISLICMCALPFMLCTVYVRSYVLLSQETVQDPYRTQHARTVYRAVQYSIVQPSIQVQPCSISLRSQTVETDTHQPCKTCSETPPNAGGVRARSTQAHPCTAARRRYLLRTFRILKILGLGSSFLS